jgi:hypothetical protein
MEISVVDEHSFGCKMLVVLELRKKVTTKYAGSFFVVGCYLLEQLALIMS